MVKQTWIERKLSQFEADRLEETWTKQNEKQFQYLLEIYRTGKFTNYSFKQINSKLKNIVK